MRSGTTIIEFLVYLAIFSFISLASMRLIADFWQLSVRSAAKQAALINRITAADMLGQDLRLVDTWHEITAHEIIWRSGPNDIGWLFKDGKLVRRHGNYTPETKKWRHKSSSLIAAPVVSAQFSAQKVNDGISMILFTMKDRHGRIDSRIAIYKGRTIWHTK